MKKTLLWVLCAFSVLAGCGGHEDDDDDGGPLMRPGENCQSCHAPGGRARSSFTVAGTVFPSATSGSQSGISGVTVLVVDANGSQLTLQSNASGNFYTSSALALPLRSASVVVNGHRRDMGAQPDGACASCHALPPSSGATGRVFAN
jgi:hypothetical protein